MILTDLGLLCRNKTLRLVGMMVVNGTRTLFLRQSFQLLLNQFGLGSVRPGNNFYTDRPRAAARCLPTSVLLDIRTITT